MSSLNFEEYKQPYNWRLNFDEYKQQFEKTRERYSVANDLQLQSIIYTQGICNLYTSEIVERKTIEDEKEIFFNEVVYKKCAMSDQINGKNLISYLQCNDECNLHAFDITPNVNNKRLIPNIDYYKYICSPHYVILTSERDILIKPRNMQYIQFGQIKKDILHMADKMKITKNMIKHILQDKTKIFYTPRELIEIVPKVMVNYNTNTFERILRINPHFFIGYSIVCYI